MEGVFDLNNHISAFEHHKADCKLQFSRVLFGFGIELPFREINVLQLSNGSLVAVPATCSQKRFQILENMPKSKTNEK